MMIINYIINIHILGNGRIKVDIYHFDAKGHFFSYNSVPFQNFGFATLVISEFFRIFFAYWQC